jgi:hypothetical protein
MAFEYKEFPLALDLVEGTSAQSSNKKISLSQRDIGVSKILFSLTFRNVAYPIPAGAKVRLFIKRYNSGIVMQDQTAETGAHVVVTDSTNGKIEVLLNSDSIANAGQAEAQIEIELAPGKIMTSQKFSFFIESALGANGEVISGNDIPLLDRALLVGEKFLTTDLDAVLSVTNDVQTNKSNLSTLTKRTFGFVHAKEYEHLVIDKGGGFKDWAPAINAAIDYAFNNGRLTVLLPPGDIYCYSPLNFRSWVNYLGFGRDVTKIIVMHNGAGVVFPIGDDWRTPLQGADTKVQGFTVKRNTRPTAQIDGNHGILMYGTFGITTFVDVHVRDMGHDAWRVGDTSGQAAGTGPIYWYSCKAETNLFGYGLHCTGLFANIYAVGLNSWGNAGLYKFDGTNRGTDYYPFQIVVGFVDSEYSGGFTGAGSDYNTGKTNVPLSPMPQPALYARYIRGLYMVGTTLQTSHDSKQHCIDIDYCNNVEISGVNDIISRGGADYDAIHVGKNCTSVRIGNVNIFGGYTDSTGVYRTGKTGIWAENVKGLSIENPTIDGVTNPVDLIVSTNKAYIKTNHGSGYITQNYKGLLDNTIPYEIPKNVAPFLPKAYGSFRDNAGTIALNESLGVTSVTKVSAGKYRIIFSKNFANTSFIINVDGKGVVPAKFETSGFLVNQVDIDVFDKSDTRTDVVICSFTVFGTQP